MTLFRLSRIFLFLITAFIAFPVMAYEMPDDIVTVEDASYAEIEMSEPHTLDADDLTHKSEIYIRQPDETIITAIGCCDVNADFMTAFLWRPPMNQTA